MLSFAEIFAEGQNLNPMVRQKTGRKPDGHDFSLDSQTEILTLNGLLYVPVGISNTECINTLWKESS